ncbi:MAG: AIR synthase-related protein, partial [Leuconostoc falkenbergense]
AIEQSLLASVHDLSEGGLIVGLLESAFAGHLSFNVVTDMTSEFLFAETPSRFIVSVAPQNRDAFEKLVGESAQKIGEVSDEDQMTIQSSDQLLQLSRQETQTIYQESISWRLKA